MIPLSRVVAEIEKQVSNARLRGDETAIRESLVAIRALCNLALEEHVEVRTAEPIRIAQTAPAAMTSVSAGERMRKTTQMASRYSTFNR